MAEILLLIPIPVQQTVVSEDQVKLDKISDATDKSKFHHFSEFSQSNAHLELSTCEVSVKGKNRQATAEQEDDEEGGEKEE